MEKKIEIRLKAYQSRENIELFFDTTNKLITELGITKEDTRFCLNVRNESNKQRISVNINSRLIGGLRNENGMDYILFMLYVEDAQNLKKQGIDLKSEFLDFKNAKELENTQTYILPVNEFTIYEKEIYPKWIKCCSDYLPTQTSSQYRKHHIPELYELTVNIEFRNKELNLILNNMTDIKSLVNQIIKEERFQRLINQDEFYLENCRALYNEFKAFNISTIRTELNELIINIKKPFRYKDLLENQTNIDIKEFLLLIAKLITYFDTNGWNINEWNVEKIVISKANLSQYKWLVNFIAFKINDCTLDGIQNECDNAFVKSIKFIENPLQNYPITSNNHRNQITKYFNLNNENEILNLFNEVTQSVRNKKNSTALIVYILYHPQIKKLWIDGIVGIMASDNTGWQDETIELMNEDNYDACILWNSKRPTGTDSTLKQLREIIKEDGSFYFYYNQGGSVNYRAKIIDFVENQIQLSSSNWKSKYNNILDYDDDISIYKDSNKSASIVFLAESIEEIKPISIDKFSFYKSSRPTQDNISPIQEEPQEIEIIEYKIKHLNMQHPLNQIFYGSPGTGKTYHTINYALSIIEKKSLDNLLKEDRAELKIRYDKYVNDGRIVFTTFHQSMSYEDFIEGIKPIEPLEEGGNISYKVVDGIFKQICKKAVVRNNDVFKVLEKFKSEISEDEGKEPITIKSPTTTFDVIYKYGNVFHVSPLNTSKKEKPWYSVSIDNIISYYNTGILTGTNQTYTREITDYLIKNKSLNKRDISIIDNDNVPNYVIIIDEINRGNVSAIFGELITLIEESKRNGMEEALEVTLPYSKDKFSVPKNVYIVGTMNTADRSVEALDTALRRRFHFTEMQPNYELQKLKEPIFENTTLGKILKTINHRIEYLLNRDHTIGHSYFLDIKSISELNNSFFKNIIPLLQEYFYGDYAKMSLVIGEGFFEKKKTIKEINWATTDVNIEKPDREVWNLKTSLTDEEFQNAIKFLLGKGYEN